MSPDDEPRAADNHVSIVVRGIVGSPGLAIGPAVVIGTSPRPFKRSHISGQQVEQELQRFAQAVQQAESSVRRLAQGVDRQRTELAILDAYLLMLGDQVLVEEVERRIRLDHKNAEWAVSSAIEEFASRFEEAEDLYLRERSHDFRFVGQMIIRALSGDKEAHSVVKIDQPSVVVAHDLSPADTAAMVREQVIAIVTEVGTRTSHTAIMARALEIPAVVGASDALSRIAQGQQIIVDALRGEVIVHPSDEELQLARSRAQRHWALWKHLIDAHDQPATTACGVPVSLRANIELPAEAPAAIRRGAAGIGLYRTEFMYIDRIHPPSEDEQYGLYRSVLEAVAPHPVTLRTFDIGGDKFASSFAMPPELNPALGLRAVRLGLARPELLLTQLRAMVRASVHGPMRIMIPMVATLRELWQVKNLLRQAFDQVDQRGLTRAQHVPLGVMLEVPSATLLADKFAREADFLSLGTNDLIQYMLAADRTNRSLAYLASPFDPSILRLIDLASKAANSHGKALSICGEMASDPLAAILLLGLGLREFSMEASAIPEIKETLRRVTVADAQRAADEALQLDTAEAVEQLMAHRFAPALADLLESAPHLSSTPA